jgi:hypothetical protein
MTPITPFHLPAKAARSSFGTLRWLVISALFMLAPAMSAQSSSRVNDLDQAIPFAELGAKVTAEDKGRTIGITAMAEGAELRSGFQKLTGTVTREGLRLQSTESEGGSLQLKASAFGRNQAVSQNLLATGSVSSTEKLVAFIRPGLVEEYSVSADGVRQDFIIARRPAFLAGVCRNFWLTRVINSKACSAC